MISSIFITGTNTGVGKTVTSALILSAALRSKRQVNYFKPLQTGYETDCHVIKEMTGLSKNLIKYPVYSLKLPASPYQAALAEQCHIDPTIILNHWLTICDSATIVEGVGGLLVPISKNFLLRDLIKLLNLRIVIVANTIVGTINHTLLTIEAALSANLNIIGIVLLGNNNYPWLTETLKQFTQIPIIAEVPWLESLQQQSIYNNSIKFFNESLLKIFFDN